jgi:hypothetical protein
MAPALEELTRPEMISIVHKALTPSLLSKKITIATYQHVTDTLVRKA